MKKRLKIERQGFYMKKIMGWGIGILALLSCLGYLGFIWIKYNNRPIVYLIPEGTKGWCHIVWDNPNANPLIETKSERILRLNERGIAHTSFSSDHDHFVEYYYIDQNGKRTEIPDFTEPKPNPAASIFKCGGGLRWIDEGPDGPFYPPITQFFLGTRAEIDEEFARIEREEKEDFPPYPEDALKLKRDKK
jgi:hypothetical protein